MELNLEGNMIQGSFLPRVLQLGLIFQVQLKGAYRQSLDTTQGIDVYLRPDHNKFFH